MASSNDSKGMKQFWEDDDWAHEHYAELQKAYPDQWIAVYQKKVLAASKDPSEANNKAKQITKDAIQPVILFIEKELRIY